MIKIKHYVAACLLLTPLAVQATSYECTIQEVLGLSDNGSFGGHGWDDMYAGRKFFFDSESGKVTGTTALKVRLSNYDADNQPKVLRSDTYQSITLFEDTGRYAVIQINTGTDRPDKPFFYRTGIGMFLTGTCTASGN